MPLPKSHFSADSGNLKIRFWVHTGSTIMMLLLRTNLESLSENTLEIPGIGKKMRLTKLYTVSWALAERANKVIRLKKAVNGRIQVPQRTGKNSHLQCALNSGKKYAIIWRSHPVCRNIFFSKLNSPQAFQGTCARNMLVLNEEKNSKDLNF